MHTKKQPQDGEASNHVLIFSNRSLEPALMAGVPGPLLGEDWTCCCKYRSYILLTYLCVFGIWNFVWKDTYRGLVTH